MGDSSDEPWSRQGSLESKLSDARRTSWADCFNGKLVEEVPELPVRTHCHSRGTDSNHACKNTRSGKSLEAWARLAQCAMTVETQRQEVERLQLKAQRMDMETSTLCNFLKSNGFAHVNSPKRMKSRLLLGYEFPLHYAVRKNKPKLVQLLKAAGASLENRNSDGLRPAELASVDAILLRALNLDPASSPHGSSEELPPQHRCCMPRVSWRIGQAAACDPGASTLQRRISGGSPYLRNIQISPVTSVSSTSASEEIHVDL